MDVQSTRELICRLGRLLYEHNMTDVSSGNISARAGKYICMTPCNAGSELFWDLQPEQILVIDQQGIKVDGVGEFPEEYKVHFQLYRNIPNGNSVIFCRAPYVMVFCAGGIPLLPFLENSRVFGEIGFCESKPSDSQELADAVVLETEKNIQPLNTIAVPVMSPGHGLFVLGRTLTCAYEAVERIEANARTILLGSLLPRLDPNNHGLKGRKINGHNQVE